MFIDSNICHIFNVLEVVLMAISSFEGLRVVYEGFSNGDIIV